jgi:cytochrome c-type biogenesis protein
VAFGAVLLTAYSAGLALPFLLAALGIGWVSTTLQRYGRVMHYVEVVMGAILILVGILLFTGVFELIAQQGQFFYIDFGI